MVIIQDEQSTITRIKFYMYVSPFSCPFNPTPSPQREPNTCKLVEEATPETKSVWTADSVAVILVLVHTDIRMGHQA